MLKPHNDDRFLADHSGKDSSIEVSTIMDAPFLSTPQEKDRNDPITISFHHTSMKNEVETSRVESSNSRKNQEWLPSSTIMKGCFQPIVFAAVASCCCFLLILVLIILTFIHPSREDFLSSSTIQRSSPLNRNSLFSTSLSRNPHAIRSRKFRKSSYGDPQPLDQYDDASSSTFLTSLVCPFSIYGSQWYEYWSNRNKSNSNHSKLFSQTEAIVNEYLPLYNQTEWVFKFPNQSSPLSCPAITINERSKSVLINYQYDADVSFYYGNVEAYCPQEDFPYDSICDRMFCFSQDMLNELEQATNDSKIFDYGLNLTSLLVKDIDLIPEGPLYTQQLSLSIMFSWMESYLKGAKISFNPILSESIWNNITQLIPELEEYSLGLTADILDLYTTCRACRDYSQYPVSDGLDICLNANLPFQCSYGNLDRIALGFPFMNQIQNYYGNLLSSSMCYCPRPYTATINSQGTDIEIDTKAEMSNIKTASRCDSYMYFWYPLYCSEIINAVLLILEMALALVITMLIWLPLLIQFIKNVILKRRNITSLKIQNLWPCNVWTMAKSKAHSIRASKNIYYQIHLTNTKWAQIVCDYKLNAASTLLFSFLCLLTSYTCDFLRRNSSEISDVVPDIFFLIALGNLFICAIPIISTWINAMKKNENHGMSMKISIPLLALQLFGTILTIFAPLLGYLYIFQVKNDYTALSLLYGMLFGIIFMYLVILILLLLYSVKMFLRLRELISISFFQFRFTRFLLVASILWIGFLAYFSFTFAESLLSLAEGEHFATRIFFLFKFDIFNLLPLLLAIALSYALFPSRNIIFESYRLLFHVVCCCGRVSNMMMKQQNSQKQELAQDLLDKPMNQQRNELIQ